MIRVSGYPSVILLESWAAASQPKASSLEFSSTSRVWAAALWQKSHFIPKTVCLGTCPPFWVDSKILLFSLPLGKIAHSLETRRLRADLYWTAESIITLSTDCTALGFTAGGWRYIGYFPCQPSTRHARKMRLHFSALCLLLHAVGNVLGQSPALAGLPECGLACLIIAIGASNCAATNQTCVCLDEKLQANATACITASCTVKQSLGKQLSDFTRTY